MTETRWVALLPLLPLVPLLISATPVQPSAQAIDYASGILTEEEVIALGYLAYPQTYADMKSRFGFPAKRDATNDYYWASDRGNWIAIEYNGLEATGFRLWEEE
jgi:hypothetical protein